jgi:hypothetical protein
MGKWTSRDMQARHSFDMDGETPLIQHQSRASCFLVTCDKCGHLDPVITAKTAIQARRIATTVFSWEMDTPFGDLCRRCARKWRSGLLDQGDAGSGDGVEESLD